MRERTIPYVTLYTVLGREDGSYGRIRLRGYATKSAANVVLADAAMVSEEAASFQVDKTQEVSREPEVKVRTDFSSALSWNSASALRTSFPPSTCGYMRTTNP